MRKNNELSDKKYWNNVHKKSFTYKKTKIFEGMQKRHFYNLVKKYCNPNEKKTVFEVGCAPGNYLLAFNKKFGSKIAGVEYTTNGIKQTKNNLEVNNVKADIIKGDFFNDKFQTRYKNKYDIVYSMGFVEHFTNPKDVINKHFNLVKNDGYLVISVPNFSSLNAWLSDKRVLDICNLDVMNLDGLKIKFKRKNIIFAKCYGGLFNFGLLNYKNPILEKIRFGLFIIQRLILDPIFIILYKLGIDFSNKYTSPQILIIVKKNVKKK